MTTLTRVKIPDRLGRSYTILIRQGLFDRLSALILEKWRGRKLFVITDSNVRRIYGSRILKAFSAGGGDAWLLDFPAGEKSKNAETYFSLQTTLLGLGIRRDSLIIALGGGVVGDIAGFVAATVLRGVEYVQVPTTLLAQVDSSVGGKVGIDHRYGKNLIGAFHQPAAVYIDPAVLQTLPAVEFRNGLAEVVKIAAALDARFFREIERKASSITRRNASLLAHVISQSVGLKAAVVGRDERDTGLRKVLNLGHTLGHAFEAATNFKVKHGVAVALGLVAESKIAVTMGLLDRRDFRRLVNVLQALKLPTKVPRVRHKTRFTAALGMDKKSEGNATKFVLLKGIGHSVVGVEVPTPFIGESLSSRVV